MVVHYPEHYDPHMNIRETEVAIKEVKDFFERRLAAALNLTRVSAPLFVSSGSGLNDNLNGVELPVAFDLPNGATMEVVHSLAKWKRMALRDYGFAVGEGLYTDMNAIRRSEETDNIHSIFVDQWDWERVIAREERNRETLHTIVRAIYGVLRDTEAMVCAKYPFIQPILPDDITFVTTGELEDRYPDKTPREREYEACRACGAVFLEQIGGDLKNGEPHDGRAPDYDDWTLNGDILVYYPTLDIALELSSMGIRVDEAALRRQLAIRDCEMRAALPFHRALLAGELPCTIGGGIGQSRMCMFFLRRAHIGEVQVSYWKKDEIENCRAHGIHLL